MSNSVNGAKNGAEEDTVNISSRLSIASLVALASVTALGLLGCTGQMTGSDSEEDPSGETTQALADDGTQASEVSAQALHVDNLVFTKVSSSAPKTAAFQASTSEALWPPGCVSREPVGETQVNITFTDCTGPFGLVHLNGTEIATFSQGASPGVLHVDLKSDGLNANGKEIDHAASADVTFASGVVNVAWKGGWTHTNANGREIEHQSDLTLAIDTTTSCAKASGTASTTVDGRGVSSNLDGYQICRAADGTDACPSGSIDVTAVHGGESATIDFDGSNRAEVTTDKRDFSVSLVCGS